MWLSQAYPGRDLAEAGKVVISDAPGFVLAAMPLELEGEQWWAVATLSPETFRQLFSRLDLLGEGRLEVYRYDGVPLFAYGSGQWLTTVERQDRFGVQLAARKSALPLNVCVWASQCWKVIVLPVACQWWWWRRKSCARAGRLAQ